MVLVVVGGGGIVGMFDFANCYALVLLIGLNLMQEEEEERI